MNLEDVIYSRRSVRSYNNEVVDESIIKKLIDAATQAPSSMNSQSWCFSVIQNKSLLKDLSDGAKKYLLSILNEQPILEKYKSSFENPDFNIFYNANTLLTIYSPDIDPKSQINCALAAQNVMLMAKSLGLGSCWIGFAQLFFNLRQTKDILEIPETYTAVSPLILGYPQNISGKIEKKSPNIIFWKK